jgi:lipopolysaccharide export LptBFGC system permease protein LptF
MKHFDIVAHILLFLGFLAGLIAFYQSRYERTWQFFIIIGFSAFYIIWGIIFHSLKRDLKLKLLLEYLLLASIAAVAGILVFVG